MTTLSLFRFARVAAVSVYLLATAAFAQNSDARARIAGPVDEFDTVTLKGNTHPLARAEFDRGAVARGTRLERMVLVLAPSAAQQEELDALVQAQHEPSSSLYRQWLTPQEYGQRFGAPESDVAQITYWLESHGFTVEPMRAGRRVVVFSGTAAQVAEAFHTQIHRYAALGEEHIANVNDPQIPRALAPVVSGVLSLHDFRHTPQIQAKRQTQQSREASNPEYTDGSYNYLMPSDYATIYDLNPLYSSGVSGSGVSIAIVGRSNITLSDVTTFRSNAGLPANNPAIIVDGANPGVLSGGDHDEATLDVEWSGAVAPNAAVKFVVAESTATTDGVDLSAQYIVDNDVAPVMSTSYGSCEAYLGSSALSFYNNLWEQAASEGISSFVASGDEGAAGCDSGSSSKGTVAAVNGICSSPYATCVGGTEFDEGADSYWSSSNSSSGGSALSYIPEKVWNESASDGGSGLWAGGGGVSQYFSQPTWQTGIVPSSANGMRTVPDVSLTAAGHDGYMICENGSMYIISGTSAASPSFAGIMALVVQQEGSAEGNANPTLYKMLNVSENPFHPTLSGNNSVPGVAGFTATGAAYNMATGLGSVDGNLLVTEWALAGTVTPKGIGLSASEASLTVMRMQSTSFTVQVAGEGGYTGNVILKAIAPTGFTVSMAPTTVATGGSATVTVTPTSTETAATGAVTITGTSGNYTRTITESVTVETPTLSVTPSVSTLSAFQTQAMTFTVTAAASSGYTQLVSLKATAPSGVTVIFSPSSIKPGATATATVVAASTSAASTNSITITGTSGGTSATAGVSLTVNEPTLSITSNVSTLSAFQTQATTFTVTAGATIGYTEAITLKATAPSGVTVTFSPSSIKAGATAKATVVASSTSAAGTNNITVTGTSGAATATASVSLTIAKPTLSITPSVSMLSAFQTQATTFTVTAAATSGYTEPITLKASVPSGVTVTFSPSSIKAGTTATATVVASSTSAAGTNSITITGTSGAATATASVSLTIAQPTLIITSNVASLSAFQTQATTFTVTAAASSGYTEPIALKASVPSGVTVTFGPSSIKSGATATATVVAASTFAAGTNSITITGTSGVVSDTVKISLLVAKPTLTLTPSASSLSVLPGQTGTVSVAVSATSCYTQSVTLTAKAPSGVTVTFSPSAVKPGATAKLTVVVAKTATASTGSITITGTGGGVTTTGTIALTIP
ncbi:protease pro-enzyme activation domain-containing protein [Terracidiphilus gabretensis]|uniref:protease pro-enzyme activation domain-containing protein n=1 Tax=Terracidiphilus gabretensis TaxID=1577687 RepID=UPI00071BAEED|nr:protease pro-enzyme activation domain-containing protein [Terracidiphilus gabretensis]